jgi:hypothetical protein
VDDTEGFTALHTAAFEGKVEAARELATQQEGVARLEALDAKGRTAAQVGRGAEERRETPWPPGV